MDDLQTGTSRVRALLGSGHPMPALAITAMIVALAARAGLGPVDLIAFTVAVLAGQLSIGWSNDVFDARRDAAAGRTDKPIVAGTVSRRAVMTAAAIALATSVLLCFTITGPTGFINLIMMAAGWAYNAGLKTNMASGLMYLIGFGLIPAFVASAVPGQPWPRAWTLAAAALLGLGGHFANVLPDLASDRASGVRGLPQVIAAGLGGERAVRLTALVLLVFASALIVLGSGAPYRWPALAGLCTAIVLAVTGARATGRVPFLAAIGIAAIDVILFIGAGAGQPTPARA